jgi:hypothetical protein
MQLEKYLSLLPGGGNPVVERVSVVLSDVVKDPSFPPFRATSKDVARLRAVLGLIRMRSRRERYINAEVLLTSIDRFKEETGFDLRHHPSVIAQTEMGATIFLALRDGLGLIALLWQIHVHPNDLRLTGEDYESPLPLH